MRARTSAPVRRWTGSVASGLAALLTSTALAQVPVTEEPRHRLVHEDARLRIFNVNVPVGDTTLAHQHDRDLATVYLTAPRTRIQNWGHAWGAPTARAVGDVNIVEYTTAPLAHTLENLGTTPYHLVGVENRRLRGWTVSPPIAAPATTLLRESRSFRLYDVRLDTSGATTTHMHAVPTVVVVVGGEITADGSGRPAASVSDAGHWLVEARRSHTLVRRGDSAAQVVEIEIR